LPLGMLIGRLRIVKDLLEPTLQVLRPVPVTAWLPLSMIMFGIGAKSAFFLVALGSFYPILVNTVFAVRSVEPRLFEAAQMLGVSPARLFPKVVLPASLPGIFTGLRLGLGFAWVVIVVGEMTGVQTGLGAMIMDARQLSRTEIVIAGIDDDGVGMKGGNEPVEEPVAGGECRAAEAEVDGMVAGEVCVQAFPEPDGGAAVKEQFRIVGQCCPFFFQSFDLVFVPDHIGILLDQI